MHVHTLNYTSTQGAGKQQLFLNRSIHAYIFMVVGLCVHAWVWEPHSVSGVR